MESDLLTRFVVGIGLSVLIAVLILITGSFREAKKHERIHSRHKELDLLMAQYAESHFGKYSPIHKANHSMQWVKQVDEHVTKNKQYYLSIVEDETPVYTGNVSSIFEKGRNK